VNTLFRGGTALMVVASFAVAVLCLGPSRAVKNGALRLSGQWAAGAHAACLRGGTFGKTPFWRMAAPTAPRDAPFTPAVLAFLLSRTGLDGEQWDNIMKLISQPAQGRAGWSRLYGHCADVGAARGFAVGLFGATTGGPGDVEPAAPILFREYDAVNGASQPSVAGGLARIGLHGVMQGAVLKVTDSVSAFCGKIHRLHGDVAWREATWRAFYQVHIQDSVQQARLRGFHSALIIGAFVDAALAQAERGDREGLTRLLTRAGGSDDESTFLRRFLGARAHAANGRRGQPTGDGPYRVRRWRQLLNRGEIDLKNADAAVRHVTR